MKSILPLFCFLLIFPLLSQGQTIRYVKPNGTQAASTATSWANSTSDLQGAINASASGDQVWVAAGTYKPTTSTTDRYAHFSMKNGVVIYGGFVGNEVNLNDRPVINPVNGQPASTTLSGDINNDGTLNGNTNSVIFNIGLNATAILNGFVITGGNADYGGAMYNSDSSPTLTNLNFIGNSAVFYGGAMFNISSSPMLTNCTFVSNTAQRGGAMFNRINLNSQISSNPVVTNCSFSGNSATQEGGAIDNQNNSTILINCAFLANQANAGSGGAIFSYGSTLRVINSSFQNNTASSGGAIDTFNSVATLTNCVAFGNGGSNTFTNQVNNGDPSGFTASYSLFEPASVTVTGMDVSGPGNLTITSSPFASTATIALNGCAPGINAGSNDAYTTVNGPTTDLSGQPRYYNSGTIDMGALEYQSMPSAISVSNPMVNSTVVDSPFSQSFTALGGSSLYSFSLVSGSLPTGLSLASTGVLSGTPTQAGSYSMTLQATDAIGCVAQSSLYTLTVNSTPIRYVKSGASGSGNSWVDASGDLQSQINLSGAQQVWVASGTYKPTAGTDQEVFFSMKNGVSIYGGFSSSGNPSLVDRNPASFPTILSGDIGVLGTNSDNSLHVFVNQDLNSSAVLDGFVLTGGNATGGSLFGGGMYNINSSPTLTNCSFVSNSGNNGGAMVNFNRSSPVLTNCSFVSNSVSTQGGALYNNISNPVLINCSFQSNSASTQGGALYNTGSSPVLTNCVLFGNGGSNTIINVNGTARTSYSLFEPTVTGYTTDPTNLTSSASPFVSATSVALNACAPAINAGSPASQTVATGPYSVSTLPPTDLAANPRIVGNRVDMGAIEYQGSPNSPTGFSSPLASGTAVCVDGTVTASVSVSGTEPFSYQWYKGSSAVNGQTTATLSLTNVQIIDSGNYSVVVTGSCNSVTSTAFSVTVNTVPTVSISANPSLSITQGQTITLTASGATSYSWASGETTPAISVSGSGSYSVTGTSAGCSSSTGVIVAVTTPTPILAGLAVNPVAVCVGSPVTFTASIGNVSGSYSFTLTNGSSTTTGTSANPTFSQSWLATESGPQTFTLTLTSSGQTTSATTNLTVNTIPTVSINPTSATLTSASPTVSLTAIGSGSYLWSTGETSPVISVTSSGTYSVTLTSPGGCTASASARVPGSDLTVNLELPQAQFGVSGTAAVGNLVVNVFEVGGLATSSGNVTITVTAPVGYTLSFSPNLPSIDVSGGSTVEVNNDHWSVINSVDARQLTLRMSSGAFINGDGRSRLGFSVTRTTANSGSTSSITVNVADDLTMRYDGNLANNVYARIISGL